MLYVLEKIYMKKVLDAKIVVVKPTEEAVLMHCLRTAQ